MKPMTIDHVVAHVADLDAAAARMAELGFTLSPRSDLDNVGVANHLVLFEPEDPTCASFFELMMPTRPAAGLHPAMAAVLGGPPAWRWFVLASADAHADHALLAAQGVDMSAPVHVRREWCIAPGESVWPEFDVTFPCGGVLPFNLCQYHDVRLYQRAEWMRHANGARRLQALVAVDDAAQASAERHARWLGSRAVPMGGGVWRVEGSPTALELWPPGAFAERYAQPTALPGLRGILITARGLARCVPLQPLIEGFIEFVPERA
jgi:hypothetical protein